MKILIRNSNRNTIICIVVSVLVTVFLLQVVWKIAYVSSGSMQPTLQVGDYIVADRHFYGLNKNDIIVVEKDGDAIIKRILATEGDTIKIENEMIYINDVLVGGTNQAPQTITVPTESYYLVGDNRENSEDSRYWDQPFIHESQIKAKVTWMLNR